MKCPDKDLIDGLHDMWEDEDRRKCPECRSEMRLYHTLSDGRRWWICDSHGDYMDKVEVEKP